MVEGIQINELRLMIGTSRNLDQAQIRPSLVPVSVALEGRDACHCWC